MSTDPSPGSSQSVQHSPSPSRRRLRKVGRALFYLLLMTSPVAAGCRPAWALGLYGIFWIGWFLIFLLPQYLRRGIGGRPLPALALLLVSAWALVQAFWPHPMFDGIQASPGGALSVNPWASLHQGLVLLCGTVVFLGASWLVDSSERIRALLLSLAIAGSLLCIVALALASGSGEALNSFQDYLPEFHTATTAIRATYSNQDRFAALLLLLIPCIVGLWVSLHFTSWRRDGPPSFRIISKDFRLMSIYTFYWLGITTMVAALILTGCRTTAIVGTLTAFGLMLLFGRKLLLKRRGHAPFLVIIILLIGQQFLFGFHAVTSRLGQLDIAWDTRTVGWRYAAQLVHERPFLGWGAGAFADAAPHLPTYQETMLWNHAHNQYLEFASSLGVPAALVLLAVLIWWGHEVISAMQHLRSRRRIYVICILWATLGILLTGLFDVPFYEPANFWILMALMGAGWGVAARPNEPLSPDEPPPSLLSWQEAHAAGSAPTVRPTLKASRLVLALMAAAGLAALPLAGLVMFGGLEEVKIRNFRNKPIEAGNDQWDYLLRRSMTQPWNARPQALLAEIGLERHLGRAISPIDQLLDPPAFDPSVAPDQLESPYRIRENLTAAIRVQPLNGELYFHLALLDYLQQMPPAAKAREQLPSLHPTLLVRLLKRLKPQAAATEAAAWSDQQPDKLRAELAAFPDDALTPAMIAEQIVLPRALVDWRSQTIRHLATASDYSGGFARMQMFCAMVRLHLWHSQSTGDAELQRGLAELRNAFQQNPLYLRLAMPMLSFIGLNTRQIDQTIPETEKHHLIAADVYREWGAYPEALWHLNQMADSDDLALHKGEIMMLLNQPNQAREAFQRYLDQPPAEKLSNRANEVFKRWGAAVPDQALEFWKTQAEKYPKEKCWPLYLGFTYDRLHDSINALDSYEQAIDGNDSAALRLRMAALTQSPTRKIEHLRKALAGGAENNLVAHAQVVLLLKQVGDNEYILQREMLISKVQDYLDEVGHNEVLPPEVERAIHTP